MGVSNTHDSHPVPAAVLSLTPPEVAVERGDDGQVDSVLLSGTMYHDGLNKNAWGLTETGAERIADDIVGRDHVASHPFLRGAKYDRSMTDGPGFPIGTVTDTAVVRVDDAMLDGGEYTAEYVSEITDPIYATRYAEGVFDGEDYSVSVGIYGDPESAECSACGEAMSTDACEHDRGQEVSSDGETEIAGPLYSDGKADHLASVYMAAYEGADVEVTAASVEAATPDAARQYGDGDRVPAAASVLAEPFDGSEETADETATETASNDADKRRVRTTRGAKVRVRNPLNHK